MPRDSRFSPTGSVASEDMDLPMDSEDDDDRPGPSTKSVKPRGDYGKSLGKKGMANGKGKDGMHAWEGSYKRSWDVVQEDDEGGLQAAVENLLARGRRKRAQMSETPLRRSIIRHMFIVLDLSESMKDKDFRPSRFELSLQYLRAFVVEWFDQNPLGQVGVILMRDRVSEVLIPMGGNPQEILTALSEKRKLEPSGEPSLQNGLVMAKGGMSHLPSTSSLECLVIFSSISTADPDGPLNIHQVLADLVASRVRTTIIALAAEIKICRQITERTGGKFGVAMNEEHLKELLWESIPPPATTVAPPSALGVRNVLAVGGKNVRSGNRAPAGDLMVMGFPTRLAQGGESLCACHGLVKKGGYLCPRCGSKMCDVPTDCEVCGLMVVSSPHLARSYWFLFPVANYSALGIHELIDVTRSPAPACHGCDIEFPPLSGLDAGVARVDDGVSATGRYRCAKCKNDFCMDCDLYIHDTLHSCPGCL
ncbi:transcription initiation factor TFIIH subunit 2, partial [Tremellales sp. Uapishka_1]